MELDGVGRYELHGEGRPVLILSNPHADPRWWSAPFVPALISAGYEAIAFIHTSESSAPEHVIDDVATVVEHLERGPVRLHRWSQGAAIAQEVAQAIPGCRFEELPDAGHLTPVTHPERVIAPVLGFLADVDGR